METPSYGEVARRGLRRRTVLGVPALGVLLGMTGCSALPELPFLGDGSNGLGAMLERIDPAVLRESGRPQALVSWSRPAAAAEALGLEESADLRAPGTPARRLDAATITDPLLLLVPPASEDMDFGYLHSAGRLIVPSEAIALSGGLEEVVIWVDAASMLEDLESAVGGTFTREGDELQRAGTGDALRADHTARIAAAGDDLLWTSDGAAGSVDMGDSATTLFHDLPGVLDALDLKDSHLARGAVTLEGTAEGNGATEWLWATRFDSAEEHTTRGALRVDGDAGAFAQRLLAGAASARTRMIVQDAEVDGDLVQVTISNDAPSGEEDWEDVHRFYTSMPEAIGPGVPVGE